MCRRYYHYRRFRDHLAATFVAANCRFPCSDRFLGSYGIKLKKLGTKNLTLHTFNIMRMLQAPNINQQRTNELEKYEKTKYTRRVPNLFQRYPPFITFFSQSKPYMMHMVLLSIKCVLHNVTTVYAKAVF